MSSTLDRQPGPDLIRCVGLLCVVGVHSFLNNGFYYEEQVGLQMLLPNSFRWLFFCCNAIFLTLTGYLRGTKPVGKGFYRGLIPVLVGYAVICVLTFPIRHFVLGEVNTLEVWISKFFGFANYAWYLEMYIGLILFSPVLNLAMERFSRPKQLLGFAGIMVFLSALPSATPLTVVPDYWTALYPMTLYVIGGVIRRLQPKLSPWLALGGAALVALGLGLTSLLTTDAGFYDGFGQGYGGFWVTLLTTLLFLGLYRVQLGETVSRVLAWAAPGCMEGYIISRLFDVWVYAKHPNLHDPALYGISFVTLTVPIFLASLLLGKAVHELTARLIRLCTPKKKAAANK